MPFEDLGLMRMVPGLDIVEPSDPVSLAALVRALAARPGSRLPAAAPPSDRAPLPGG